MNKSQIRALCFVLVCLAFFKCAPCASATSEGGATLEHTNGVSLWDGNADGLFDKGKSELGISIGPGLGLPILGSDLHHNWVIGMVQYGYMLSGPVGVGRWHQGNWELLGDLFGGFQYHPAYDYVVGIGPAIRYNFLTGTRWVPFVSAGAGITLTDIRGGDLGSEFEFNLRAGPGLRYFVNENVSATLQLQFIHISDAGMTVPNLGLNNLTFFVGVNWLF